MEHLHPQVRELTNLSDQERITHIKSNKWIGYTRSKHILEKLEDLLEHPPTHRMPNLLIVGDTNNGKTVIVNKFQSSHSPIILEEDGGISAPAILIQAPPVPDEKRFYNAILERTFAPYKINDRVEKKQQQVIQILRRIGLKVLIIDEIHHILAGNLGKQKVFLNVLKYISNELQISLVGVGTKDAFNAMQSEEQLSNRFEPLVLPRWQMNEEYFKLLMSFESVLPLKEPSNLIADEMAIKILSMSDGLIGEISTILKKAAEFAIKAKSEKITLKTLNSIDWKSPEERRRIVTRF